MREHREELVSDRQQAFVVQITRNTACCVEKGASLSALTLERAQADGPRDYAPSKNPIFTPAS
jgi:hypothetical protein